MHLAEAYWTNLLKNTPQGFQKIPLGSETEVERRIWIPKDIWNEYVNGIFTKTICEARNLNQLNKVEEYIGEINRDLEVNDKLVKNIDYGIIRDKCLTELTPENEDGTTTIGIWFRPLPDDIAHKISKKYKLYHD